MEGKSRLTPQCLEKDISVVRHFGRGRREERKAAERSLEIGIYRVFHGVQ